MGGGVNFLFEETPHGELYVREILHWGIFVEQLKLFHV